MKICGKKRHHEIVKCEVRFVGHYIVLLPIDQRRKKKKKKPQKQTKWGRGGYFILSSDIPPAMMASLALWGFSFPFDPKINNELPRRPSSGLHGTFNNLQGWGKPHFVSQPMHWVLGYNEKKFWFLRIKSDFAGHKIIQIHNSVLWDWRYYEEFFPHLF